MEFGRVCLVLKHSLLFHGWRVGRALWVNFGFLLNQKYMCKATVKRKWIIIQGKHDEIFLKRKQKIRIHILRDN